VLGLWLLAIIIAVILKRKNSWPLWGFGELLLTYMIVNRALILEILIGNSSYVSHREEMISSATPFFETFRSVFLNSSQHAPSLHKYLILPIVLFLILGAFCKKEETDRILYKAAVINFLFLIAIALFYAFCHLSAVVDWKNNATGFFALFSDAPCLLAVPGSMVSGVRMGSGSAMENKSAAYGCADAGGKACGHSDLSASDTSAAQSEFRHVSECEPDQ
jgi:hypothetical protein